jgi:hypothetical protein
MSAILDELCAVIHDRQANSPPGSYTVKLLDAGEDEVLKKVGKEAVEIIIPGRQGAGERTVCLRDSRALLPPAGIAGRMRFDPGQRQGRADTKATMIRSSATGWMLPIQ